jgi:hypothetical protein
MREVFSGYLIEKKTKKKIWPGGETPLHQSIPTRMKLTRVSLREWQIKINQVGDMEVALTVKPSKIMFCI